MSSLSEAAAQEELTLRRDWTRFGIATILFAFGFAVYGGVFQNFMRDQVRANEFDVGSLESLREIPGFLTALMAGTLAAFAESRIAAVGLAITAVGIGITGAFHAMPPIIAVSIFWSVGFHLYATMQSPITLTLARGKEGGRHLGRMAGLGGLATIAALGVSWIIAQVVGKNSYNTFFVLGGLSILGAAIAMGSLSHHAAGTKRQPIVFRREYGLYYLLIFLEGCRRQIFSIFASFSLILVYHVPVQNMLALQFLNAILIAITAPRMGKWIDKVGERTPLMFYAVGLIIVFLGYALIQKIEILYLLFIIDNVLFTFTNGFTMYLNRIVRLGELTPSISMGITVSHVAAVAIPVSGAWLWHHFGNYQIPFWVGVVFALVSLVATQYIPKGLPPKREAA
jgi:MFS family permease